MTTKESPADKAKREAEEKNAAALKAKEKEEAKASKNFDGDSAERLTGEDAAAVAKTADDVKTDEGEPVEATGPVMTEIDESYPKHRALTDDELKDLVGELEPGEDGYLPLDPKGRITGPAKRGKPPEDQLGAAVHAVVQRAPLTLTTPSGAPITTYMNPSYPPATKPRYG